MIAKFIERPVSGQYPEKHYGKSTPDCTWVLFPLPDALDWVGSFPNGYRDYSTIVGDDRHRVIFVVARGNGFLIDGKTRELVGEIVNDGIVTAIADYDRQRIIYSDGLDIVALDFHGNQSLLHGYFVDEIELRSVTNNILVGDYRDYRSEFVRGIFQLDLISGKMTLQNFNEKNESKTPKRLISMILNKVKRSLDL